MQTTLTANKTGIAQTAEKNKNTGPQVQILNKAVFSSHSTNTFGMNERDKSKSFPHPPNIKADYRPLA